MEIGRKRVRFRDAGTEFSLSRSDPQLRHLDHAYCTTVHAAQGRTARGAIAILDAGGATDQAMFHVEISRVKSEFLLLTDDREALIELLEGRADTDDGALEAMGIDPGADVEQAATSPDALSSLDARLFAELDRNWRALERRAAEADTLPVFLPGYSGVMARAAGLAALGDLTGDLKRLVDGMLAQHRRHLAREREIRALAGRIQDHWRRWPELGWQGTGTGPGQAAEETAGHAAWRAEAAALAEAAQRRLAAVGVGHGEAGPDPAAVLGGLAAAVADLERTRLLDDARRFESLWAEHRGRAAGTGVPELLGEGYAEVEELGARLEAAGGLEARAAEAVADWRGMREEQAALAEAVRTLAERVAAWRASPVPAAADPAEPARAVWRAEGEGLEALGGAMLGPDDAHAPFIDASPGARDALARAAGAVADLLDRDRRQGLAWLTREVNRLEAETGTEAYYLPRYGETVEAARALAGHGGLSEKTESAVASWLEYDGEAERLRGAIRDWPARAGALLEDVPPPDAALDALTAWRERAERLLEDTRAMNAADGPYTAHMERMPGEWKAMEDAARNLDAAAPGVEHREMRLLMREAGAFVEETGGILYDAPVHGALIDRARSLGARDALSEPMRRTVAAVTGLDARCAAERERVGAFLGSASEVVRGRRDPGAAGGGWENKALALAGEARAIREEIPPRNLGAHLAFFGAGPDRVAEEEKRIRERIEREREARAAEEAARRQEEHRRDMERLQAMLDAIPERADLSRELRECLKEREAGDYDGLFFRRDEYPDWLARAGALQEKANRHLDAAEKRAAGREEEPGTDELRDLKAELDGALREDREKIERIENERAQQQSHGQDRSRGRGFSM